MTRFAREAGRGLSEGAVFVDGVGDGGVDAAGFQRRLVVHPHVEVFAAVAGRGVDETGAGVFGDVLAFKERNVEVVAFAAQGMRADNTFKVTILRLT